MEISITKLKNEDKKYYHEDFTIFIENHRILTIYTDCDFSVAKWVQSVKKTYLKKKHPNLIVGVCTGSESYFKKDPEYKDNPFEQITLCIGSHCLIYDMPDLRYYDIAPALRDFLTNPNIFFVGMGMEAFSVKLDKVFKLKVARPVDIGALIEKDLGVWKGYLKDESLDMVVKRVLGKKMDVVRPKNKIHFWTRERRWWSRISEVYAKYSTVDAYLAHEIGMKFFKNIIKGFF